MKSKNDKEIDFLIKMKTFYYGKELVGIIINKKESLATPLRSIFNKIKLYINFF